jgi:hypothetical protein
VIGERNGTRARKHDADRLRWWTFPALLLGCLESAPSAESVLDGVHSLRQNILMETFIEEARGLDYRAVAVGGSVVEAMSRRARAGEFRGCLSSSGLSRLRGERAEGEVDAVEHGCRPVAVVAGAFAGDREAESRIEVPGLSVVMANLEKAALCARLVDSLKAGRDQSACDSLPASFESDGDPQELRLVCAAPEARVSDDLSGWRRCDQEDRERMGELAPEERLGPGIGETGPLELRDPFDVDQTRGPDRGRSAHASRAFGRVAAGGRE